MKIKWMICLGSVLVAGIALLSILKEGDKELAGDGSATTPDAARDTPNPSSELSAFDRFQGQAAAGIEAARAAKAKAEAEEWAKKVAHWDEVDRKAEEYRKKQAERAAAQAAREQAEREWWEDRKEWIENFPFTPTYHPTMTFKPSKQGRDKSGYWKWNVRNPEERKMMLAMDRHSFVKDFYENPLRHTKGFEMLYNILDEYGYGDNIERLGNVYTATKHYYAGAAKAAENPDGRAPGMAHNDRGYETWKENTDGAYDAIMGNMLAENRLLPDETQMPGDLALEIRERILNEIPKEEFTKQPGFGTFAYNAEYNKEIEPGDPLLMR